MVGEAFDLVQTAAANDADGAHVLDSMLEI
jgi:hypothetical protein